MASTALSITGPSQQKRKQLTYGKRSWNAPRDLFARFDQPSPESSPRQLKKPSQSAAQNLARRDESNDERLFDVPSSGDEKWSRKSSPGRALNRKPGFAAPGRSKTPTTPTSSKGSDPFEVPSSDNDDEARRTTIKNIRSKPKEDETETDSHAKPSRNASTTKPRSRKRSRVEEASGRDDGKGDTSRQIDNQLEREMEAFAGAAGPTRKAKRVNGIRSRQASQEPTRRPAGQRGRKHKPVAKQLKVNASDGDQSRSSLDLLAEDELGSLMAAPLANAPRSVPSTPMRAEAVVNGRAPDMLGSPKSRSSTPGSALRIMSTPKQAKLWDNLLEDKPEKLPTRDLENLALASARRHLPTANVARPIRARKRMIDNLEAPAEPAVPVEDDEASATDDQTEGLEQPEDDAATLSQAERVIPVRPLQPSAGQLFENGPKITYARQRSYLDGSTLGVDALLEQPLDEIPTPAKDFSGRQAKAALQTANSSDDEEDSRGIRNLHELRAAKETRRIAVELDAIMIDLDSGSSLSTKRGALLDLCNKLLDQNFRKQLVEHGYEYQIFKRCSNEFDAMSGSTIAACVALILNDKVEHRTSVQLYEAGVMGTLVSMLDKNGSVSGIARERRTNMSKIAQKAVSEFATSMQDAPIWKEIQPQVISPQILALRSLELLTRRLREAGSLETLLDGEMLKKLLLLFNNFQASFLAGDPEPGSHNMTQLEMVLSILESATIAPLCCSNTTLWNSQNLELVAGGLTSILCSRQKASSGLQTLALRLCLNLTNNNEHNSHFFAGSQFVKQLLHDIKQGFQSVQESAMQEDDSVAFDGLILSLGTMINLAEWSEAVRSTTSSNARQDLVDLTGHFLRGREKSSQAESMEASRANIPFGYLAILLGNLCLDDGVRSLIQSRLPKGRLDPLLDAVDEFILYHKLADDNETFAAFSSRLQVVADSLRAFAA